MSKTVEEISNEAVEAVKNGSEIVIISDNGVDDNLIYVPSVIATGAIQYHSLIKAKDECQFTEKGKRRDNEKIIQQLRMRHVEEKRHAAIDQRHGEEAPCQRLPPEERASKADSESLACHRRRAS
jgi:hypothetical protein